jgi:hypothetical protein
MEEQTMYPVCPHRNVIAAYQRFLGPDSGGIERFFGDERVRPADATQLMTALASACNRIALRVQLHDRWTPAGMVRALDRAAVVFSAAVALFNPFLTRAWIDATYALSTLMAAIAAQSKQFYGVWLPSNSNKAPAVLGRWTVHYRVPLAIPSRTLGRLPV